MHEEIKKMFDLSGKVAVVTGGARDLGHDAATVLAAAGCHVAITSRKLEHAQKAAEQISRTYSVDVLPQQLDQTDFQQVAQVASRVYEWKGAVNILINNAGGGVGDSPALLFERDPRDFAKMIDLNLTGVLYCCREFSRIMVKQRSGKIVNIASIAGIMGRDRRMYSRNNMDGQSVDYAGAKAGVIGLTMDLAGYLSPMGIYVNCITPGGFYREGTQPKQFVQDYSDRTPLGRMGRDGIDMKGPVLFLASSASDYVTGYNLIVDGGFSIWH
jgi:NAD(P)-dependent dehydrogenase (short-subunit alcohol dehydrogenase family)